MKQIYFYFCVLFLGLSFSVNAKVPEPIDTAKFKCVYQFKFLTDSINMTYRDKDLYVIQIGDNFTKSYCYKTFYIDSLHNTPDGNDKLTAELNERFRNAPPPSSPSYTSYVDNALDFINRGWFQFYVYKDYQKEKITVTDNISSHYFTYEDELKPQNWIILEDTINILGYSCQKAKCSFRDRDWEAWFASDIPIDEGPWKFYGLPGLIMKLEDIELHYSFKMIGLQQVNEPIYETIRKDARKINRLSFLRLKMKVTGTDLVAMDLAKVGISSYGNEEIYYDYIERDYKEK